MAGAGAGRPAEHVPAAPVLCRAAALARAALQRGSEHQQTPCLAGRGCTRWGAPVRGPGSMADYSHSRVSLTRAPLLQCAALAAALAGVARSRAQKGAFCFLG